MTTTPKTLYRTIDLLALKLLPDQPFAPIRDQQAGESYLYVWRPGQPAPELIRDEDVEVYGGVSCSNE
jgi:hypothetical protein